MISDEDRVDELLEAAPLDDEPTTAEEEAGVAEARADYDRGVVFDPETTKRELG